MLAIALNLLTHPHSHHDLCKTPFQPLRLQLCQRHDALPSLTRFHRSWQTDGKKSGLVSTQILFFCHTQFFCAVEPYVLGFIKNIINGNCLNPLLLVYLLYHCEERPILYFYVLPMNQDFFFQK